MSEYSDFLTNMAAIITTAKYQNEAEEQWTLRHAMETKDKISQRTNRTINRSNVCDSVDI